METTSQKPDLPPNHLLPNFYPHLIIGQNWLIPDGRREYRGGRKASQLRTVWDPPPPHARPAPRSSPARWHRHEDSGPAPSRRRRRWARRTADRSEDWSRDAQPSLAWPRSCECCRSGVTSGSVWSADGCFSPPRTGGFGDAREIIKTLESLIVGVLAGTPFKCAMCGTGKGRVRALNRRTRSSSRSFPSAPNTPPRHPTERSVSSPRPSSRHRGELTGAPSRSFAALIVCSRRGRTTGAHEGASQKSTEPAPPSKRGSPSESKRIGKSR
jgi:hypothetical protein